MDRMKIMRRSVWDDRKADMVVVTSNGSLTTASNSSTHLSMQQGVSFEAARQHPWLPAAASNCILDCLIGYHGKQAVYGFASLPLPGSRNHHIGLFQSKYDWREPANLALIGFSAVQLMNWLNSNLHVRRVSLNFPGLGLIGGLTREQVEPLLESVLDERVIVCIGPILGE